MEGFFPSYFQTTIQMGKKTKFNKISDKLKEEIKKHAPKKGQVIYFEMVKKRKKPNGLIQFPTSVRIPSKDTIYDPFTEEWVDIAFLSSEKGGDKDIREIVFYGSEAGRKAIRGDVPGDIKLFSYLFLCNYNKTAKGSIEKTRPNCGFLIEQVEPALTAKEKLKQKEIKRLAVEKVDEFPEYMLRDYAVGLKLPNITEWSDPDEIRLQLIEIAEKKPDTILNFDKDFGKKFEIYVSKLEQKGVIEHQSGKWVWGDTQDVIFTHQVGENKVDALKKHIVSHPEVKDIMDIKIEGAVEV